VDVEHIPELLAITDGLVDELQKNYPTLLIFKSGQVQATIFYPNNFAFVVLIVNLQGIIISGDEEIAYGPIPLEDPELVQHVCGVIDRWLRL
jgi:hypothetical protein